jgi:prevent-host-death family protein
MGTIAAAEFKAKCLHVLDEVEKTREPITVTKRGRPVARIVPIPAEPHSLFGIAEGTIIYNADDDLLSTGEAWDADR